MKQPNINTLARACGCGNKTACKIGKQVLAIYAGSMVKFNDPSYSLTKNHPNKLPFQATLLICDEPSDKPPHGSQGHRILVRSDVAKEKLKGLPGMAVNYDPSDMDEHETRHKVGVITKAWMEGPKVQIAGFVWKKDFPEAERDLKRKDLGTSMELADVYVDDEKQSVWDLSDFEFTGATILKRNAAAYTKTNLTAAAQAAVRGGEGEKGMAKEKDKKRKVAAASHDRSSGGGELALMTQALSGSITTAFQNTFGPVVKELKASNEQMARRLDEFIETQRGIRVLEAAAEDVDASDDEVVLNAGADDSDDDESSSDIAAGAEDASDSDSDAMAANGDDASESDSDDDSSESYQAMEDLGLEDASESTGEVNKDASNKGSKHTVTKPPKQGEHFKGNVAKGRLHSAGAKGKGMKKPFPALEAAAEQIRTVRAENRKLIKTLNAQAVSYKKMKNRIKTLEASVENFADREARRSVMPRELTSLAAKAGVNLPELKAAGEKLSIEQFDRMFLIAKGQGISIEPQQRIAMKMLATQEGILEDGTIQ